MTADSPTAIIPAQLVEPMIRKFPSDLMFQLSRQETVNLVRCATNASPQRTGNEHDKVNRSQIVTGSQKHRDPGFLRHAFTEQGALMVATLLNRARAVLVITARQSDEVTVEEAQSAA